jgi:hypothetical protein
MSIALVLATMARTGAWPESIKCHMTSIVVPPAPAQSVDTNRMIGS